MTLILRPGMYCEDAIGEKHGPIARRKRDVYFYARSLGYFRGNGVSISGEDPDLIREWVEPKAEPTPFRDMSDAEKGALLLADFNGKMIEVYEEGKWVHEDIGVFLNKLAYRVAPDRITGTCEVGPDGKPDFSTWEGE